MNTHTHTYTHTRSLYTQALRSFCDQFARIKELMALITDTSLQSMVDAEGTAQEEQLFKLVPLKDGVCVCVCVCVCACMCSCR
jgi:hypothetical protein